MNTPIDPIEEAFAALCLELYRLRMKGEYVEAYEVMGSMITILAEDRQYLRERHKDLIS